MVLLFQGAKAGSVLHTPGSILALSSILFLGQKHHKPNWKGGKIGDGINREIAMDTYTLLYMK